MASELTTVGLEPMLSLNIEQPYMANCEQSLHLSHAASVAGRGTSMHQFAIWAQFPWVHILSSPLKGGGVTLTLHDALKLEGIIIFVQLAQLKWGLSYEPAGLLDRGGGCATPACSFSGMAAPVGSGTPLSVFSAQRSRASTTTRLAAPRWRRSLQGIPLLGVAGRTCYSVSFRNE